MATTANIHAPLGAATILHVVDAFIERSSTVVEWKESRKTRKLLSELSDAQLDDIGLSSRRTSPISDVPHRSPIHEQPHGPYPSGFFFLQLWIRIFRQDQAERPQSRQLQPRDRVPASSSDNVKPTFDGAHLGFAPWQIRGNQIAIHLFRVLHANRHADPHFVWSIPSFENNVMDEWCKASCTARRAALV